MAETSESSKVQQKTFEIESAQIFASWSFKSSSKDCNICRNCLESPCVECETNTNISSCVVSNAKCGHVYHKHCIDKWVSQQKYTPLCPICKSPYATNVSNLNNNTDWVKLAQKSSVAAKK